AASAVTTDLVTTKFPNTYMPFRGTSAAAPHVAAIAALILSGHRHLTPAQVKLTLIASAIDIESAGFDNVSGYGVAMLQDRTFALADSIQGPVVPDGMRKNLFDRGNGRWGFPTVDGNGKPTFKDGFLVATAVRGAVRMFQFRDPGFVWSLGPGA